MIVVLILDLIFLNNVSLSIVFLGDIIVLILPPIVFMFHVECSIVGLNYLQIVKNSLE